jgi:diguanylate cyclase (GGDEF)-like protein/PAS domain S-box-containing protein
MNARENTEREKIAVMKRELAEDLLRKECDFVNAVLNTAGVLVVVINREGKIVRLNCAAEKFTGYPLNEVKDIPFFWERFLLPDQRQGVRAVFDGIKAGKMIPYYENHWVSRDGEQRLFAWANTLLCDSADQMEYIIAIGTDITERNNEVEKLHLAASVFTHAREGILITTPDGTIIEVNDTFTRITGYSRDEVLGHNTRILGSGRQGKEFYAAMWRDLIEQGHWYGEIWNRRKNGEVYAEMLTISAVRDAEGNTRHYVSLFSDITALKEHEKQLEHIAHYDVLTGLPNRLLLADRMHQAMAQAQRRGQRLAVAYLDLDGFKAINDHHGHDAGDQLLMIVTTRMKQALREGDTLARMGGDEFVAVLIDLTDIETGVQMFTRLLAAAAQPVPFGDIVLQVSASLGITFYPQAEDVDADQLLRQSDQAMYRAKLAGKNRYHIFDAEQDRRARRLHESMERIRRALCEREFVLYYQPKVNMSTGKIIGAEALIRWQHPEKGLLLPGTFLPVIEDHPLAVEIGEWVIDSALTQMEIWRADGLDIPVSVNVGASQLQHADFVERLCQILEKHQSFKPGDLEMEVQETSALDNLARISQVIDDCREIGVMFALDDFGTGYSSLTYLKRLPVAQFKIDQSFVRDMLGDPDDLAILDGVIGLANSFRKQVIAEGVETPEHGEILLRLGCKFAQGYGIARPMAAHMLPGWTADWQPDSSWVHLTPVSREDLPLLFAGIEHRAWIAAIENCIRVESEIPTPLDHHQCNFGKWLDGEGLARYGAQPAFNAIELLHQKVHVLALHLLELQAQNRKPEALARLGELHGLRDTLIEQMKTLA